MSDYIPDSGEVRGLYSMGEQKEGAEFDRWLNQVKAEAWDEGYNSKWYDPDDLWQNNPYRRGEEQ